MLITSPSFVIQRGRNRHLSQPYLLRAQHTTGETESKVNCYQEPPFQAKTRRLTFAARRAIMATDGGSLHGGLLPNQGHKTADRGHLYGGFALFPIVFARFVCGQQESGNRKQDHQDLIIVHTPHSLPLLL